MPSAPEQTRFFTLSEQGPLFDIEFGRCFSDYPFFANQAATWTVIDARNRVSNAFPFHLPSLFDECSVDNGGCGNPSLVTCTNVPGDLPSCTDIDECAVNNGGCGQSFCINNFNAAPTCGPALQFVDEVYSGQGGTCTDPAFPIVVAWDLYGHTPRSIVFVEVEVPGVTTAQEHSFVVQPSGDFSRRFELCFPSTYQTDFAGQEIRFTLIDRNGNRSNVESSDRLPPATCTGNDLLFRFRPSDLGGGLAIPDGNVAGVSSTISFRNTGATANKVVVFVNFLEHSFVEDLSLSFRAGGVNRSLATRVGGAGDDFVGTIFDDACTTPIASGTAPFLGCFTPEQSLAPFAGQSIDVDWSLQVVDNVRPDAGTLVDWMLGLCL